MGFLCLDDDSDGLSEGPLVGANDGSIVGLIVGILEGSSDG